MKVLVHESLICPECFQVMLNENDTVKCISVHCSLRGKKFRRRRVKVEEVGA